MFLYCLQETQDLLMVKIEELGIAQEANVPLKTEIELLRNLIEEEEKRYSEYFYLVFLYYYVHNSTRTIHIKKMRSVRSLAQYDTHFYFLSVRRYGYSLYKFVDCVKLWCMKAILKCKTYVAEKVEF